MTRGQATPIEPLHDQGKPQTCHDPFRQDFPPPPHPRSIPGRLGREWISNGSGLEREPLARVTPGSLQTISSLYDVSEQARDQSHMQFVFSPKDNVFRQSLNQPSDQFGTLDCISNQERSAKSTKMVELVGIEPTTPCLQSRCSPS